MLVLTFRAAENLYAVEVTRVVEVVPRVELRRLPHAPAFLAGLFDYRGCIVPVVDLAKLLGGEACRDRLSTRVILLELTPGDRSRDRDPGPDQAEPRESEDELAGLRGEPPRGSRRQLVGLIAEHVSDVASIKADQVISPPMHLPQAPYLGAIVELGQDMTQLIVVDHVLEKGFREAFFRPDPAGEAPLGQGTEARAGSP